MTVGRYVEGVIWCVLVVTSTGVASFSIRKRLLPAWFGAPARLAEIIIGISLVVVVSELLGSIGLFRTIPLVGVLAVVALLAFRFEKRRVVDDEPVARQVTHSSLVAPNRPEARWEPVAAVVAVGLVVAEWSAGTIHALRNGVSAIDTYWYHMPLAVGFVQTGSVITPHNINNDNAIEFYPATSELLHAVGILLLGSDFLSPLANILWLALTLFAAWCLGRRYGVGSISILAMAVVLGTAQMVSSEPGTSYNDIAGAALVVAALALLAYVDGLWDAGRTLQGLWVAALAAGLAVGVKDTLIIPVAALTVGVIVLVPRGQRARRGLVWCLVVAGTGGFWYVRNAIYAGNPVPNVHLRLGPIRLPSPPNEIGPTIAQFLLNGRDWTSYFLPGLEQALGPAWWAFVVLTAAGLIGGTFGIVRWRVRLLETTGRGGRSIAKGKNALCDRHAMAGLLALVGLATLVGYLVTPQPNLPVSFVFDFRFSLLTFICGLIALPVGLGRSCWVSLLVPIYGGVMIGTQFAQGIWFGPSASAHSLEEGLLVGVPVVLLGLALIVALQFGFRWLSRSVLLACSLAAAIAIAVGFPVQRSYLANWDVATPYPKLDRWASTVHDARIGDSGLILNYPLYGSDLSNDVEFLGTKGPHDTYSDIGSCGAWRQAINEKRLRFVVTYQDLAKAVSPAVTWTRTDAAAKIILSEVSPALDGYLQVSVYAIKGPMSVSGCPGGQAVSRLHHVLEPRT